MFVTVDRAISETDSLEKEGEVESATTIGFDAYGLADASLANTLEASLFFCGKPIGMTEGKTHPFDTVFAFSECNFQPRWGAGNYFSQQIYTGGGIVSELHDEFTALVRGSDDQGFSVVYSFFGPIPNQPTATTAHVSVMMFKARSATQTEYRHRFRRNGQSYALLGLQNGRRLFGFNMKRIRQGIKVFANAASELQTTGTIKERS
jgi:hypothetical protein